MFNKRVIYESSGVKEYWIVSPDKSVDVFILMPDGKYDSGTTYDFDARNAEGLTIPVKILQGLNLTNEDIFPK
jgi:Uma2 family endonuclease